jgi:hypothetical protein
MKRFASLLLLAALAAPGCLTLPPLWTDLQSDPSVVVETDRAPLPPPPVLPEQVNEANAKEMLNALREELDYAATEPTPAPKPAQLNAKAKP